MKVSTLIALSGIITLSACSKTSEQSQLQGETVVSSSKENNEKLEKIFEKIDYACAGNDNGALYKIDPKTFSAGKVMKELKADQNPSEADSCLSVFSSDKQTGVNRTLDILFGRYSSEASCVNGAISEAEAKFLKKVILDPSNLGVFSKEWDSTSGDSEYCMYSNYDVYRADGTVLRIVFNHTT